MATFSLTIAVGADDISERFETYIKDSSTVQTKIFAGDFYSNHFEGGIRFINVTVPQGTSVVSATISLDVLVEKATPTVEIIGDDVDDAAAWASGSRPSQITPTTAVGSVASGTGVKAVAVTAMIQELVNRTGFASSNDMRFNVDRTAYAFSNYIHFAPLEHESGAPPKLTIVYAPVSGVLTGSFVPTVTETRVAA